MVIILSFVAGGLVNPIESGTDYYFNQPIIEETSAIVSQDPNATWIISGNIYISAQSLSDHGGRVRRVFRLLRVLRREGSEGV